MGAADPLSTLTAVRELHKPVQRVGGPLACYGCDPGYYAEDNADWPCSTAKLVYDAAEIAHG